MLMLYADDYVLAHHSEMSKV